MWVWLKHWFSECQGRLLVSSSWFSTLVPSRTLLLHKPSNTVCLSLGGSGSGLLAWRLCEVPSTDPYRAWKLDASSRDVVHWHFVTEPAEWVLVGLVGQLH